MYRSDSQFADELTKTAGQVSLKLSIPPRLLKGVQFNPVTYCASETYFPPNLMFSLLHIPYRSSVAIPCHLNSSTAEILPPTKARPKRIYPKVKNLMLCVLIQDWVALSPELNSGRCCKRRAWKFRKVPDR
jgi:hypothetical protein